jgi:hypothetical protein
MYFSSRQQRNEVYRMFLSSLDRTTLMLLQNLAQNDKKEGVFNLMMLCIQELTSPKDHKLPVLISKEINDFGTKIIHKLGMDDKTVQENEQFIDDIRKGVIDMLEYEDDEDISNEETPFDKLQKLAKNIENKLNQKDDDARSDQGLA